MTSTVYMSITLNTSRDRVIPHNVREAHSLLDLDKRLGADDEEMVSIHQNKVIAHTSSYLPNGVIAITTVLIYVMKRTLMNTIER